MDVHLRVAELPQVEGILVTAMTTQGITQDILIPANVTHTVVISSTSQEMQAVISVVALSGVAIF